MKTPMHPTKYLGLHKESTKVDATQYKAIIGSLLSLTVYRSDIMFNVCVCKRFQQESREVHLTTIKRIFRYFIRTPNLGLLLKRRECFRLTSFCDAGYAHHKVEKKNTSGSCQYIGGNIVTWIFNKQSSTTLSTTEVEYMSIANCCNQLLWIKN